MKISKIQILQLSVLSVFVALLTIKALFDGTTERMIILQNTSIEALKFMMHYFSAAIEFITPVFVFLVVAVICLFMSLGVAYAVITPNVTFMGRKKY